MRVKQINRGFTLIEILVVLFIVSIIVTIAVVVVGNTLRDKAVSNAAEELQLVMRFASDEAVLSSTPIGFNLKNQGYQFSQYLAVSSKDKGSTWQALNKDRILGLRKLAEFIEIVVQVKNKTLRRTSSQTEPSIIFYSDGTITPFTINLGEKNANDYYELIGKSNGELTLNYIEPSS